MTAKTNGIAVPQRGRRHTAGKVAEARRMFEAGWTVREISGIIETSELTTRRWVDPAFAARRAETENAARRRYEAHLTGGRFQTAPQRTPEFRAERMLALRDAGLSFNAIATVINFDFGTQLTGDNVRHRLDTLRRRVAA